MNAFRHFNIFYVTVFITRGGRRLKMRSMYDDIYQQLVNQCKSAGQTYLLRG